MFTFLLRRLIVLLMIFPLLAITACGQSQPALTARSTQPSIPPVTPTPVPTPTLAPTPPAISLMPQTPASPNGPQSTVFLITMENHNWSEIIGNPDAPYINHTLLPASSYATQYYNPPGVHPSEPNYLWLEAGTSLGVTDDNPPAINHQSSTMHLTTLLNQKHISWKAYIEDISGSTCPLASSGLYASKHNPMIFFDDVTNANDPQSAYCISHERPSTELARDLQQQTTARYNFIAPDLCNDMHDSCDPLNNSIRQGDHWLSTQIPLILASQAYKNSGYIFITWDEGEGSDGPIGLIVLSSHAKGGGYSNAIHYTHSSTLRTVQEIFGITPLLGDAAHAADLSKLFSSFP